jgi:hypothetical protein
MKEWSAMLAAELNSWPHTSTKPMFGFLSFYRNGTIFAALPQTRGFDSASSMILKFNPMAPALLKRAEADQRMDTSAGAGETVVFVRNALAGRFARRAVVVDSGVRGGGTLIIGK